MTYINNIVIQQHEKIIDFNCFFHMVTIILIIIDKK